MIIARSEPFRTSRASGTARIVKVLTQSEARLISAIGQTLFPRDGEMSSDSVDAGVVAYIDRYLSELSLWDQIRLRGMFQLFELGITVMDLNPTKRFTTSFADERVEYLRWWEQSEIYAQRMIFAGLRSVFLLAYFGSSDVSAEFGMDLDSEPTMDAHLKELARLSTRIKPGTVGVPAYVSAEESLVPDAASAESAAEPVPQPETQAAVASVAHDASADTANEEIIQATGTDSASPSESTEGTI